MYKNGSLCFNIQFFYGQNKNGKEKKRKMAKNLTLPHADLIPGFLNKSFLSQDLNFEGD